MCAKNGESNATKSSIGIDGRVLLFVNAIFFRLFTFAHVISDPTTTVDLDFVQGSVKIQFAIHPGRRCIQAVHPVCSCVELGSKGANCERTAADFTVTLIRVAEEGSIGLLIRIIARTPLACSVHIGLIEEDFRISSLWDVCWLMPCLVYANDIWTETCGNDLVRLHSVQWGCRIGLEGEEIRISSYPS